MQIMKILHDCMEKDIMVYTIKEHYEMGNNINSKVLAFDFGLSAEIERNLISQHTKEARARKKAEVIILGWPINYGRRFLSNLYLFTTTKNGLVSFGLNTSGK